MGEGCPAAVLQHEGGLHHQSTLRLVLRLGEPALIPPEAPRRRLRLWRGSTMGEGCPAVVLQHEGGLHHQSTLRLVLRLGSAYASGYGGINPWGSEPTNSTRRPVTGP